MNDIKVILDDGEISYGQLAVGTVTTGEAGTEATVTNKGTSSRAILDFTIPRGEKGEKGDTGEQGIQGVAGKDGVDGTNGTNGKDGANGKDGKDGKTPVKGVDYFTEQEIEQITNDVISAVGSGFTKITDTEITLLDLTAGEYITEGSVNINYYDENWDLQTLEGLPGNTYIKVTSGLSIVIGLEFATSVYDIYDGTNIYKIIQQDLSQFGTSAGNIAEVVVASNLKTINGNSLIGKGDISVATTSYVDSKVGDIETLLKEV